MAGCFPNGDFEVKCISVANCLVVTRNFLDRESLLTDDFYRRAYWQSPVPMCEWDFGDCFRVIRQLKEQGEQDIIAYFQENTQELYALAWTCRPLHANPAACQLIGVKSVTEFCSRIAECYNESSMSQFLNQLASISRNDPGYRGLAQIITFDGETKDIFTEVLWPEPDTEDSRVFVAFFDLTELSVARHTLSERNRQLATFATIAAHDLKEPLRMITGFASILEQEFRESEESAIHDIIKKMAASAGAMKRIIDDALSYAQAGIRPAAIVTVNLSQILEEITAELETAYPEKTIKWEVTEMPEVKGDKGHTRQIFRNLLTNAVKYTSGSIIPIRVAWQSTDRIFYRISVCDRGIGIAPEFQERVFLAFQRLGVDGAGSSGIGLAICRRLVEGIGGRLSVESEPGKGSCFHIDWPRMPRAQL